MPGDQDQFSGIGNGRIWGSGTGSAHPNTFAVAALKADGSVVTWGTQGSGGDPGVYSVSQFTGTTLIADVSDQLQDGVQALYSTNSAFAALKADGSVVTWGNQSLGGDSSAVAAALESGVTEIFSTQTAFAALKEDGSVVTWGNQGQGGNSAGVAEALSGGVVTIHSTQSAFAAIKADGSVVTWGAWGGNSSAVADDLAGGVVTIASTERAFAALKADGSVVTWGIADYGGDSSALSDELSGGVSALYSTGRAFAALKEDGSVVAWGQSATYGADTSAVADDLAGGVVDIYNTNTAFAAVKEDGSVVTWGWASGGGNSAAVSEALSEGVVTMVSTPQAFAALMEDGTVVVWGGSQAANTGGATAALQEGDVVALYANQTAFAALREDGSVVTWGTLARGGDSSAVADELAGGVVAVYPGFWTFAAVKEDGSVVTWGTADRGGDSSAVADDLAGGVVDIATPFAVDPLDPGDFVAPPAAPVIDTVAGDDVIGPDEAAEGLTVTGTAEPEVTVTVTFEGATQSTTAGADGAWQVSFGADDIPGTGEYTITAQANRQGLNSQLAERAVTVSLPPEAPVIDTVAGNDLIDAADADEGLTVTGTAEPEVTVTVTLDGATQSATAGADGTWQVTFPPEDFPDLGDYTITAQASRQGVDGPVAERSVSVIAAPDAPVIDTVAGDDVIDPDAAAEGVTVTGSAAPGATVAVGFAEVTQTVTADAGGAWQASFGPDDIPEAGDYTITAQATLDGLTGPSAERSVTVSAAPEAPEAPVIDTVAGDDVIDPDAAAEGVTVTGSAAPGATVAVTFAEATQTVTADAGGAWQASFGPDDIPEAGDYTITAQATLDGLTGPSAERSVTVSAATLAAPEIAPVGVDDVVAPETVTDGLDVRGFAEPGAQVTVIFGDVSQTVTALDEGLVVGGWETSFAFDSLPPAGEHILSAQATLGGLTSPVSERLVTIENMPAQILGDTTGTVIEDDPTAEQFRGSLTVIDRDEGEDRFQTVDAEDLETPFGSFLFDPLIGDWAFVLDNDSPAVQALDAGEEATATLSVTSFDGSASETITVTVIGAGLPEESPVRFITGSIADTSLTVSDDVELIFLADDGSEFTTTSSSDGTFSLELPVGISGQLEAMSAITRDEANVDIGMALDALRLAVGLQPSWVPPTPLHFVAADFNGDGRVRPDDALDILRVAVGLNSQTEPRWVFLDADADLSQIGRNNTTVETGRRFENLTEDAADIGLVSVLIGNLQEFA